MTVRHGAGDVPDMDAPIFVLRRTFQGTNGDILCWTNDEQHAIRLRDTLIAEAKVAYDWLGAGTYPMRGVASARVYDRLHSDEWAERCATMMDTGYRAVVTSPIEADHISYRYVRVTQTIAQHSLFDHRQSLEVAREALVRAEMAYLWAHGWSRDAIGEWQPPVGQTHWRRTRYDSYDDIAHAVNAQKKHDRGFVWDPQRQDYVNVRGEPDERR